MGLQEKGGHLDTETSPPPSLSEEAASSAIPGPPSLSQLSLSTTPPPGPQPLILQRLADLFKLQRLPSFCLSLNNPAAAPEGHARRGEFQRLSAAESLGPIPLLYKTTVTQERTAHSSGIVL